MSKQDTKVRRFAPDSHWNSELRCDVPDMSESPNGEYVLYSDYAGLEAEVQRLREVLLETRRYSLGHLVPNEWYMKRDAALAQSKVGEKQ